MTVATPPCSWSCAFARMNDDSALIAILSLTSVIAADVLAARTHDVALVPHQGVFDHPPVSIVEPAPWAVFPVRVVPRLVEDVARFGWWRGAFGHACRSAA